MSDNKRVHEGRNVKRFREIMGIKQEALAWELGEEWSQKRVSMLEQKETIDRNILEKIAEVLKVPLEAIRNFDEEKVINIISNTFNNHDQSIPQFAHTIHNNQTYIPLDKWLEALEEVKQLNAEIIRVKDEQIELLKEMAKR